MTRSKKLVETVAKYGFTYKGLALATIVFPPAGLFIAWQWKGKSAMERVLLASIVIGYMLLAPTLVAAGLAVLYTTLSAGSA